MRPRDCRSLSCARTSPRDAAAGAAIGAIIAIPVPLIGPITGAAVGAAIGVVRNFFRKGTVPPAAETDHRPGDLYAALLKLGELRDKGILTEEEFDTQKRRLLSSQ